MLRTLSIQSLHLVSSLHYCQETIHLFLLTTLHLNEIGLYGLIIPFQSFINPHVLADARHLMK